MRAQTISSDAHSNNMFQYVLKLLGSDALSNNKPRHAFNQHVPTHTQTISYGMLSINKLRCKLKQQPLHKLRQQPPMRAEAKTSDVC